MARTRSGDSLGIGLVGAGFLTREFHANNSIRIRDAHCAGVMNPTESEAESLAAACREHGVGDPAVYGDVREPVRDSAVDAPRVVIPNHVGVATVEAIAEGIERGRRASMGWPSRSR